MSDQQGPNGAQGTLHQVIWQPGWGREFGGEWMHAYAWLSPWAVYLELSQHCSLISYIQ